MRKCAEIVWENQNAAAYKGGKGHLLPWVHFIVPLQICSTIKKGACWSIRSANQALKWPAKIETAFYASPKTSYGPP